MPSATRTIPKLPHDLQAEHNLKCVRRHVLKTQSMRLVSITHVRHDTDNLRVPHALDVIEASGRTTHPETVVAMRVVRCWVEKR